MHPRHQPPARVAVRNALEKKAEEWQRTAEGFSDGSDLGDLLRLQAALARQIAALRPPLNEIEIVKSAMKEIEAEIERAACTLRKEGHDENSFTTWLFVQLISLRTTVKHPA